MNRFYSRSLVFVIAVANASSLVAAPLGACRVKSDVMRSLAQVENNAGCVIARTAPKSGTMEILMVRQNNAKVWGVPGGTMATRAKDLEEAETKSVAASVPYPYSEPVPCTASRETHEEIGLEVIVGDLIMVEKKFHSFECTLIDKKAYDSPTYQTKDKGEIAQVAWMPLDKILAGEVPLRFQSNIQILNKWKATRKTP